MLTNRDRDLKFSLKVHLDMGYNFNVKIDPTGGRLPCQKTIFPKVLFGSTFVPKPKHKSLNRIYKEWFYRKTCEANIVHLAKTHLLRFLKSAETCIGAEIEGAGHENIPFLTSTSDAPD